MSLIINRHRILFLLIGSGLFFTACYDADKSGHDKVTTDNQASVNTDTERTQISDLLDSFNVAAGKAQFDRYFSYYTDDAIFTGTDATERWDKKAFMLYAKPFFDRGKAWHFTSIERHIYFDQTGKLAWFDELLNTQMKICRGSGVVVKQGNDWKVQQYILSATIPNEKMDSVVTIKTKIEDALIQKISKQ